MITINRQWWEQLAPKAMHRRRSEVEKVLRNWCKSEYGRHWLRVACQPNGVMRVVPGQIIPVVHLIALGDAPIYVAPHRLIRVGHRMVGPDTLKSGHILDENELALAPEIRLDVVSDPIFLQASTYLQQPSHPIGVTEPSIVFSVPAHCLLSPTHWPDKAFALYQHIFGNGSSYPDDGFFYVGITKRRWQTRWAEHRRAIVADSPLLFHRTLRQEMLAGNVTYIHHKVMAITNDLEKLYATEKFLIEGHWEDTRRLNMVPGGKAGLRYLREYGMAPKGEIPTPDTRDGLVSKWITTHPEEKLPGYRITEKWKDEAWAAAQICSRRDRFSVDQIRAIRELASSHTAEEIADRIGARETSQIQSILEGRSYTRVV